MSEQIFHVGVKALIQNKDGEVLLVLNKFPDRDLWDIPGDRMDEGEDIGDALKRELKEELGLVDYDIGDHFMTVKSNKIIAHGALKVGLMLIVYKVAVNDITCLESKEDHSEVSWKGIKEASLLLRDKYPSEFCDKVGRL